jgi:uncharacterized iron-regulated membrane protein
MKFKKIIGKIHLILGLATGLVVFIVAVTGAIWTFETEILDLCLDYRKVTPQETFLPPSDLLKAAKTSILDYRIGSISYLGKDRSAEITVYPEKGNHEIFKRVYINPYDAKILHVDQNEFGFFDYVIELHVNLLLGDIGKEIVDYATLIFVVLLISGIILWWPKNKKARKQRVKFKWKPDTKWRRKNYDLHNILGFYASWVVVFVAITGLSWGFEWVSKGIYAIATLGEPYKEWKIVNNLTNTKEVQNKYDLMYFDALKRVKYKVKAIEFYFPEETTESTYLSLTNSDSKYNYISFNYDSKSGVYLDKEDTRNYNNGEFVRSLFYDIHIGKIFGLPTQLLVFFASLIVASLPITGFVIWWGRRNKTKKVLVA